MYNRSFFWNETSNESLKVGNLVNSLKCLCISFLPPSNTSTSYYLECCSSLRNKAVKFIKGGGCRILPILCIARKNCGDAAMWTSLKLDSGILTLIERDGYWSGETSAWRFRRVDRWTCKGGNRCSTDMAWGNKAMWTCHLEVCPSCCRRRKSNL